MQKGFFFPINLFPVAVPQKPMPAFVLGWQKQPSFGLMNYQLANI